MGIGLKEDLNATYVLIKAKMLMAMKMSGLEWHITKTRLRHVGLLNERM